MPRENVSSGVPDQARHKRACAAPEASSSLEIMAIESRDITLSKQRTTKALIRLRACASWSAPLMFAYDIRHIFSRTGSYKRVNVTNGNARQLAIFDRYTRWSHTQTWKRCIMISRSKALHSQAKRSLTEPTWRYSLNTFYTWEIFTLGL